jgi:hypothetical protein
MTVQTNWRTLVSLMIWLSPHIRLMMRGKAFPMADSDQMTDAGISIAFTAVSKATSKHTMRGNIEHGLERMKGSGGEWDGKRHSERSSEGSRPIHTRDVTSTNTGGTA